MHSWILDDQQLGQGPHSPNLVRIFHSIHSGDLAQKAKLAARIERGDASGSEEETLRVYDDFVDLMNHVIDLANMVRRREEYMLRNNFMPQHISEIAFASMIATS